MTAVSSKIGARVRSLRREKGWSQEKLALTAGLDRTYISSLESGKRNVSISNIEKIADALGVTIADFFDSEVFAHGDRVELARVSSDTRFHPRVLAVDDEPMILDVIRDLLAPHFEVDIAESVEKALSILRQKHFDVVLIDYNLPPTTAIEALKAHPQDFEKSAVVLMTGAGTFQIAAEALALGVKSLLTKPLDPHHLHTVLTKAALMNPRPDAKP